MTTLLLLATMSCDLVLTPHNSKLVIGGQILIHVQLQCL